MVIANHDGPVELRQLTYVEAVARLGGFTRAARQLHVAQSAVSAQVRALEAELGTPLLVRTSRGVVLTPAGELFLPRARRALAELADARAELAEAADGLRGRLTIGVTPLLGGLDLPAALARFHRLRPGVDLAVRSGLVGDLLAMLDRHEVDLVVGPVHADLPSRYVGRPLVPEELVLVTPPGHRLAGAGAVGLRDVADEPFVCLPPGSGLRAILDGAAAAAGLRVSVRFDTHSPESMRELVAAGLGVAVVARSAVTGAGPDVAVLDLDLVLPHPPIGLIQRRDRHLVPAAHSFAVQLTEAVDGATP